MRRSVSPRQTRPGPRQAAQLRARRGDTSRPDDVTRPLKQRGGIYPRKGQGAGELGIPQFPDIFQHWDMNAQWQSWRKGFDLAHSGAGGALLTIDGATVLDRDSFWSSRDFISSEVMLFRFGSRSSPTGAWTVTVKPRGISSSASPLSAGSQVFQTRTDPISGYEEPVCVVSLAGAALQGAGVEATVSMVGELVDDSVDGSGNLLSIEGAVALLCLQVEPEQQRLLFDASRFWRYEQTASGNLVLREHAVPPGQTPPPWRIGNRITESMVLSCNCPAHLGVQYLVASDRLRLGSQGAFPQQGGQSQIEGLEEGEGVKRRFRPLQWERRPGLECKHCQAARWTIGAPTAEPSDLPSLSSDLWSERSVFDRTEEMGGSALFDQLVGQALKTTERQMGWMDADMTLLSASIGDAFSVFPQLANSDYEIPTHTGGDDVSPQRRAWEARQTMMVLPFNEGRRRFNRMKHVPESLALQISSPQRGDWWTGRGIQQQVMTYSAAHVFEGEAIALKPLARLDVHHMMKGVP